MGQEFDICPLCGYEPIQATFSDPIPIKWFVNCPRCGRYTAEHNFMYFDPKRSSEIGYILSGLTRERNEINDAPNINTQNVVTLATSYPVPDVNSIEEKANKFLQRLRHRTQYYGQTIEFGEVELEYPLAYAKNVQEFVSLLELLQEKKLIRFKIEKMPGGDDCLAATLLESGWNLVNYLGNKNKDSNQGFVAIWFDDSKNECISAIEDGIRETGYKPVCIKWKKYSERIMDKALSEIRRSRFVVVDLSGKRGSVFFEAGLAHGLGIETIYVREKTVEKDSLEFYVGHYQCYEYNNLQELKDIVKDAVAARIGKKTP